MICPVCNGQGYGFPTATVGMWEGLTPFIASPEPCWLCNGDGIVEEERGMEVERELIEYYSDEE